jgi:hypothetical protein
MLLYSLTVIIKKQSIQGIFILGIIVTLWTIYGPYSIMSLSLADQYQRLVDKLIANGFTLTQLRPIQDLKIENKDAREIANHIQYIAWFHGPYFLKALIPSDIYTKLINPSIDPTAYRYPSPYRFTEELLAYRNIPFPVDPFYQNEQDTNRSRNGRAPTYIPLSWYDHLIMIGAYRYDPESRIYTFEPLPWSIQSSTTRAHILEWESQTSQSSQSSQTTIPQNTTYLRVDLDEWTIAIIRSTTTTTNITFKDILLSHNLTRSTINKGTPTQPNLQETGKPEELLTISWTTDDGVWYTLLISSLFASFEANRNDYILEHIQATLLIR